jgi:hypothetical protein
MFIDYQPIRQDQMRQSQSTLLWVFLSSFSITGLVTFAVKAQAAYERRAHVAECFGSGTRRYFGGSGVQMISRGVENENPSALTHMRVFCPVPNDTCLSPPNVTQVNVHGRDFNPGQERNVRVRACRTRWDTNSMDCGTEATTWGNFSGEYTLSPGLESWWNGADFHFIEVTLPHAYTDPTQAALRSTLRGFWVTGNGGCN